MPRHDQQPYPWTRPEILKLIDHTCKVLIKRAFLGGGLGGSTLKHNKLKGLDDDDHNTPGTGYLLDNASTGGDGIDVNARVIDVSLAILSGLRFAVNRLLVNAGDGLVITGIGSGPLEIDLTATPGLEFVSGQLQVKDGDGIVKTASGVEVSLGLINAGLDFIAGRLQLNLNTLILGTPVLTDFIAIHDVTVGASRKVTVESLFATNILRAILPVFDAYDSVGYQTINGTASVLNLDTVEVNTDASTFSIASDVITIARTGVLDITVQITEGTTGTSPFEFAAFIRRNGVEIVRTRRHSGGEILP